MNGESDRWAHLEDYEVKYCRTEMALYDEIMMMTDDIRVISDYYGVSEEETQRAKDYAFGSGVSKYEFLPDIDMAKAWFRMAQGEGTEIDRVFLQHEILESDLVINQNMDHLSAHVVTEARYNWRALLLREKKT